MPLRRFTSASSAPAMRRRNAKRRRFGPDPVGKFPNLRMGSQCVDRVERVRQQFFGQYRVDMRVAGATEVRRFASTFDVEKASCPLASMFHARNQVMARRSHADSATQCTSIDWVAGLLSLHFRLRSSIQRAIRRIRRLLRFPGVHQLVRRNAQFFHALVKSDHRAAFRASMRFQSPEIVVATQARPALFLLA